MRRILDLSCQPAGDQADDDQAKMSIRFSSVASLFG
jgi:hypothetical protein